MFTHDGYIYYDGQEDKNGLRPCGVKTCWESMPGRKPAKEILKTEKGIVVRVASSLVLTMRERDEK